MDVSWRIRCLQLFGQHYVDRNPNSKRQSNDVRHLVTAELQKVRKQLLTECEEFRKPSVNAATEREKGHRLLYLFQQDLIPGIQGQIIESKKNRDNFSLANVTARTKKQKVIGWVSIALIYLGMLCYILLFSLEQSGARQFAWFKSFLTWAALDVCLVCTGVVYITHMLVPMIAMRDIAKIQQKLLLTIKEHYLSSKKRDGSATADGNEASANTFNAAEHLFVSYRLAQLFPKLVESAIILKYATIWPKQSYQHQVNVSTNYSKKYSMGTKLTSLLLVYGVSNMMSMPSTIHDMVMHIVTTTTVGYMALLHLQLWAVYPALVVAPALVLCGIAYVVIRGGRARARAQLAQVIRADDDASVVGKHRESHTTMSTPEPIAVADVKVGLDNGTRRSGGANRPVRAAAVVAQPSTFVSRRDSVRAGQQLVLEMQTQTQRQLQQCRSQRSDFSFRDRKEDQEIGLESPAGSDNEDIVSNNGDDDEDEDEHEIKLDRLDSKDTKEADSRLHALFEDELSDGEDDYESVRGDSDVDGDYYEAAAAGTGTVPAHGIHADIQNSRAQADTSNRSHSNRSRSRSGSESGSDISWSRSGSGSGSSYSSYELVG
jgi:hypothetical protein